MNTSNFATTRLLIIHRFFLLAIASGLIVIQLTLTAYTGDWDHFGLSMLFWLIVADQLWKKHQHLRLGSSWLAVLVGALLITWVLVHSFKGANIIFLLLSPFVAAVGLGMLASGFQGLKQYWQELLILFFLGVPRAILSGPLVDITPLTAQFSAFLLWCCGFKVSLQGVEILLPNGGVRVNEGCSGIEAMTYLLGLSVIFLVMFPTRKLMKVLVPFVGLTLGFVVNGVRVALLAILVAAKQIEAFDYWHGGDGSKLFALFSVLLFSLFCLGVLRQLKALKSVQGCEMKKPT